MDSHGSTGGERVKNVGRPRIGLNVLFLRPGRIGGSETYVRGLLHGLANEPSPFDFVLFLNRDAYPTFEWCDSAPNIERVLCPVSLNPELRHIWEQIYFSGLARRHRLAALHSLGYVLPLRVRCPQVVTIHDMIYRVAPASISRQRRWFWSAMIPRSAKVAKAVITGSGYSRDDIIRFLGVPAKKVKLTPYGPGQELPEPTEWEHLQSRYGLRKPYFLAVGGVQHKRLDVSERALEILAAEHELDAELIVTGLSQSPGAGHSRVRHLGYIPAEDLAGMYAHALALVSSSDIEGFGMPVLEAFRAGTPVIAASRAALVEVVGSGGIAVTHGDAAALAGEMLRVATDPTLRADLRERGFEQAQRYSWRECARATLAVYAELVEIKRARAAAG